MKVLKEMLLHHIEEEESKYFNEAKKCFDATELNELGENFIEEKKKIMKSK